MMGGVSAVVEFACVALEVTDIIVCGHSDCGAMKALLAPDDPKLAAMPTVKSWLRNADAARSVVDATQPGLAPAERVQALVEQNVRTQLAHLQTHPAVYGIEEGSIQTMENGMGKLVPLEDATRVRSGARG
jgi:carbonic anhydrase